MRWILSSWIILVIVFFKTAHAVDPPQPTTPELVEDRLTTIGLISPNPTPPDKSRCGEWTPYLEDKCVKIVMTAGHQTKQDSEIICRSFADEERLVEFPTLVTVKTAKEQEFLQQFLFVDHKTVDHVWLGIQNRSDDVFEWSDGSTLHFTNWAKQNLTHDQAQHYCVQMESGTGVYGLGEWVKVACTKTNIVVCERTQPWTLLRLQNAYLRSRLDTEIEMKKAKEEIISLHRKNDFLQNNPVPIDFIYIQLPKHPSPEDIWKNTSMKWKDVSGSYEGLFFRVSGPKNPFGRIQESQSPHLANVEEQNVGGGWGSVNIPLGGGWSGFVHTGSSGDYDYAVRFQMNSAVDTFPRNTAVRIWRRFA